MSTGSKNVYIFTSLLDFGSASCNRLFAYSSGFTKLGYHPTIIASHIFRMGDCSHSREVDIKALPPTRIRNKYLRQIAAIIYLWYYLIKSHSNKDNMMVYGIGLDLFCFYFSGRTNVWVEQTECPEVFTSFLVPYKIYYWLCRKMRGMFVISSTLKDFFISKGIEDDNIRIINMIVDPARFNSIPKECDSEKYLAYCGIVSQYKDGIGDLLRSFAVYHKMYPDRKLKIIGGFYKDVKIDELYNELKANDIYDSVEFLGVISPDNMPQMLAGAEMLLLCRPDNIQSKYGFPTKLGEYLLTQRPVVVTNVGDVSKFLKDRFNALVVPPNSIDSFAKAMIWCSEHPKDARDIAFRGKRTALACFNNVVECEKIINCFINR